MAWHIIVKYKITLRIVNIFPLGPKNIYLVFEVFTAILLALHHRAILYNSLLT